jgi:hypothetical protein
MTEDSKYVRFDWAIKRILRDKANKGVLEGLMTVLLNDPTTIEEILEPESNQDSRDDKYNRVDVKARTSAGDIIIVEVQLAKEFNFLQRILFGTSKAVTEQVHLSQGYEHIKKVYSVNILYFDLGEGDDYAYHGKTVFRGMTRKDSLLRFTEKDEKYMEGGLLATNLPDKVFPEYFLLRVNQFDEVARTPFGEWMRYLKDGIIMNDTKAPGLQEAKEKLAFMKMTDKERRAYEDYMISVHAAKDVYQTAVAKGFAEGEAKGRAEGRAEGEAKGRAEGEAKGRAEGEKQKSLEIARKMKAKGMAAEDIADMTGLPSEEIAQI